MLETRALVVDDDEVYVDVLSRGLRNTVRCVDQETDACRAIDLFAAHKHSVVVLDLRMPKMSGLEVMRQIHQLEPRTQVIIVTGFADKKSAIEALNLHAFGLLEKPVSLERVYELVTAAFAQYQQHSDGGGHHDDEIEALYQEVAALSAAIERAPQDRQLQSAYRQCLTRLRDAQAAEADLAARSFRDSLALKKGMGYSSIEAATRVLDRDKNSA
jgi:DNA-binding NtrC family response regulator